MLALLGPVNTYTAYFMPESLYFFSFWLLTCFLLHLSGSSASRSWCLAGILLGLSALIKPHALFCLPAIVAYVVFVARERKAKWLVRAFCNAGALLVCALLTKLSVGYLFAGKAGVTLFGPNYTSTAHAAVAASGRYLELLALSIQNVKGHALAMCLMFGAPIVFAMNALGKSAFSKADTRADEKIAFYALAVLVNLILVVGLFTASVAGSQPQETVARLHMRYYNFTFPLLLVMAASQLSQQSTGSARRWRVLAAFPIASVIAYALYTHLAPFAPDFVDNPELYGFVSDPTVFYVLSTMSLVSVVVAIFCTRAAQKLRLSFCAAGGSVFERSDYSRAQAQYRRLMFLIRRALSQDAICRRKRFPS